MKFFKKILTILILINIIYLSFLISNKNKFFIKNPKFGTVINQIINDKNYCKKFNSETENIFEFAGKGIIFNIYSIENSAYKYNLNLINKVLEERLNVNIIDIIYYDKILDENSINDFILRQNINRPVFYVDKNFLNEKLSINSNSIIISDFDINNVVRLGKMDYTLLEENIKNLYQKTKKIKVHPETNDTKVQNDELLIKSVRNPVIITNNEKELFFIDKMSKKIFGIYLDGSLNYSIGNGKNDDGLIENIGFNNISSIKEYNNKLYILDSFSLKKVNFDTKRVDIVLQDGILEDINDFCILDKNKFLFSKKNGELIIYKDNEFKVLTNELDVIKKIGRYNNRIYLLGKNNSKLYVYYNNKIRDYFKFEDTNIIDFAVYGGVFYLLNNDNKIYILEDEKIKQIIEFDNVNNIKYITVDNKDLYFSDDMNIYKINLKDLNNHNYEKKLKKIDFRFSYKSKNYFKNNEYDFYNYNKVFVWQNNKLLIDISNNNKINIDWEAPNYINLYELNDKKIINIQDIDIVNNNIIFDNIDISKNYYLNGKVYYRYNNEIFVKKINDFVYFKDNHLNKNIEINFNNIYIK